MGNLRILEKTEQAYKNMEAVCAMLNALCKTDTEYWVGETWFDHGQGWRWTTIINNHRTQVLNPREWEEIEVAQTGADLVRITDAIRNGKYFRE